MGKIGVVLAILAIGSMAVILLSALWARIGASGDARVQEDELASRRAQHPQREAAGRLAVVTVLHPELEKVSGS